MPPDEPVTQKGRCGWWASDRGGLQSCVQLCSPRFTCGASLDRGSAVRRQEARKHHSLPATSWVLHSQDLSTAPTHPAPCASRPSSKPLCFTDSKMHGDRPGPWTQHLTESCGHLVGGTFIRVALRLIPSTVSLVTDENVLSSHSYPHGKIQIHSEGDTKKPLNSLKAGGIHELFLC